MRSPKDFFQPLAVGAPEPLREIPVRPARMIHFFPPHLEKVTAKLPEIAPKVDVLLGNLEDAIPMDSKEAARAGFVKVAKEVDFGDTQLWTRVNSLDSPWVLDDLTTLVGEVGEHLGSVQSGVPVLDGDDHAAFLGPVLLAQSVEIDSDGGVLSRERSHVLAPWLRGPARPCAGDRKPCTRMQGQALDLQLGCKV